MTSMMGWELRRVENRRCQMMPVPGPATKLGMPRHRQAVAVGATSTYSRRNRPGRNGDQPCALGGILSQAERPRGHQTGGQCPPHLYSPCCRRAGTARRLLLPSAAQLKACMRGRQQKATLLGDCMNTQFMHLSATGSIKVKMMDLMPWSQPVRRVVKKL